jgi:hypothetical protein
MTQNADTRSIEENLEKNRAALRDTVDELQDRFSVDRLAEDALGFFRSNAGDYTKSIDRAVRANPMAIALTGVGIAWLIFGGRKPTPAPTRETVARWESEGGNPLPDSFEPTISPETDSTEWADRIDALRSKASSALRTLEAEARSYAGGARDFAAERAKVLSGFTEDMRKSMLSGLDDLSDTSRKAVVQAREKAYAARIRVSHAARAGSHEIERLVKEHPMIAGVVAMALGAALAAALPRTRAEDRTFGSESDRLMAAAAKSLREERENLSQAASGLVDDLKVAAKDVRSAISEKVAEVGTKAKAQVMDASNEVKAHSA